jgi:transcription antitermination factor NusG
LGGILPTEWYALRSKPNKEELLLDQLLIRKVETYFPRLRIQPVNPRSRHIRPYFPGYMFVNVDLRQISVFSLAWIPGASRLVCFDGQPAAISAVLVTAIQKKVDAINAAGGEVLEGLKHGDRVTIQSGPFAGYEGIFDTRLSGNERMRVLLRLMQNRQIRVEVPVGLVQPI